MALVGHSLALPGTLGAGSTEALHRGKAERPPLSILLHELVASVSHVVKLSPLCSTLTILSRPLQLPYVLQPLDEIPYHSPQALWHRPSREERLASARSEEAAVTTWCLEPTSSTVILWQLEVASRASGLLVAVRP